MSSILTNASALSALQSLSQTQSALQTTGKPGFDRSRRLHRRRQRVLLVDRHAADHGQRRRYGGQPGAGAEPVGDVDRLLGDQLDHHHDQSIKSALTQATNPTANIGDIQTTLGVLGQQLQDAVSGASFNGLNLLDGSQTAALDFVSGFNATTTGGTVNTIDFTSSA